MQQGARSRNVLFVTAQAWLENPQHGVFTLPVFSPLSPGNGRKPFLLPSTRIKQLQPGEHLSAHQASHPWAEL